MPTYDVLIKKSPAVLKVKSGFSWPAFLFGPWWALSKNMWTAFVCLFLLWVSFRVIEAFLSWSNGINTLVAFALWIGPGLYVGMKANSWYRAYLEARGYEFHSSGDASTAERVIVEQYAKVDN